MNSASECAKPAASPGTENIITNIKGNVLGNIRKIPAIVKIETITAITVFFIFSNTVDMATDNSSFVLLVSFLLSVKAGKR